MIQDKVTILIPAYNVVSYLPKCIDSILGQTYYNLQVVIIDDGSKDDTFALAQSYVVKDRRVEVYHQENQGVAVTRNNLLEKVKGDWVLFIDADDWIEHDMIEFLVNETRQNDADVSMCGMVVNDTPVSEIYKKEILDQQETIKRFLFHNELRGSLWNKLVKTSLLHNVKFHSGISYGEDALFCWHIFQKVKNIVMTNRQLYHYRMNDASISHQSFGERKFSGHQVWEIITEDTSRLYPQYLSIAQARHCVEDILLFRDAAHSQYPFNDKINLIKSTIIRYRHLLFKVRITSTRIKLYSIVAPHSYWLASKF